MRIKMSADLTNTSGKSMTSRSPLKAFTDAAAHAVAREIASLRREARRERELQVAEHRATLAELEARLVAVASLERQLADRLSTLTDGADGADGAPGRDGVDGKDGVDGEDGRDGHDVDDIIVRQDGATVEFEFHVADRRTIFEVEIPEGPPGQDGKDGPPGVDGEDGEPGRDGVDGKDGAPGRDGADGLPGPAGKDVENIEVVQDGATVEFAFTVGDTRSTFEVELPAGPAGENGEPGEKGEPGPPGKLGSVEPWVPGVHYEGDIRAHNGATWQARKDTADEPGGDDWTCIAARGLDG
jgi:hypothetical protein